MTMKEAGIAFARLSNALDLELVTSNTVAIEPSYCTIGSNYYKPRRLKCVYCGCISGKESGICEHCGAPLIEDEY